MAKSKKFIKSVEKQTRIAETLSEGINNLKNMKPKNKKVSLFVLFLILLSITIISFYVDFDQLEMPAKIISLSSAIFTLYLAVIN